MEAYRTAEVYILFEYGIDDIRANLRFLKQNMGSTVYTIKDLKLDRSLKRSIQIVEEENLEQELRNAVIELWNEIEEGFQEKRKPKVFW